MSSNCRKKDNQSSLLNGHMLARLANPEYLCGCGQLAVQYGSVPVERRAKVSLGGRASGKNNGSSAVCSLSALKRKNNGSSPNQMLILHRPTDTNMIWSALWTDKRIHYDRDGHVIWHRAELARLLARYFRPSAKASQRDALQRYTLSSSLPSILACLLELLRHRLPAKPSKS